MGKNPDERALMLESMIDLAAADGVLDPQELKRLRRLSKLSGISKEELTEAIRARWSTAAPSNATRHYGWVADTLSRHRNDGTGPSRGDENLGGVEIFDAHRII